MAEIRIGVEAAKKITGRCQYHGAPLCYMEWNDDGGFDSPFDIMTCTMLWKDPETTRLNKAIDVICARPDWPTARRRQEDADEFDRLYKEIYVIRDACLASWVLIVPDPGSAQ